MGAGASSSGQAEVARPVVERPATLARPAGDVPAIIRTHWCHQCENRVVVEAGECVRCGGGFIEELSMSPEIMATHRLVSAFAAHFGHHMLDRGESGSRLAPAANEGRIEELLRDLQAHIWMVTGRTQAVRPGMTGARIDPAGPSVWQAIKHLDEDEVAAFLKTSDDQCVICCADYSESPTSPMTLCELPGCSHVFHEDCLKQWLARASNCPICRNDLKQAATLHAGTQEEEEK